MSKSASGVIVEDILNQIKSWDEEDKQKIKASIQSPLVVSGSSIVNNGIYNQINDNSDEIAQILEGVSPETLGELLKAISKYILRNRA